MPVQRELWKKAINKTYMPPWHCPSCSGGYLHLKADSLHYLESSKSIQSKGDEEWEIEWVAYRFCAMLKCNNESCHEAVSVAGNGGLEMSWSSASGEDCVLYCFPDYVNPSPILISIPKNCPALISDELRAAFVASWGDFPAAANRIRSSVERLLDHLKVVKTKVDRLRRRKRLTLHERIESLAARYANASELLLAIKWLGNAGSHSSNITRDDIFDALDILELALAELFSKDRERITKLAKDINRKKGPARRP